MSAETDIVICRVCLNECTEYKSIHRPGLILGEVTTLSAMLHYCTSLNFPKHEEFLPCNMCGECIQNLAKAYAFKERALKSDDLLRRQQSEVNAASGQETDAECPAMPAQRGERQKKDVDHSYVTLTVEHDDDSQSNIVVRHVADVSDDDELSRHVEEHIEDEQIEAIEPDGTIYEAVLDDSLKIEEDDYESETFEVTFHDDPNSLTASISPLYASEVDEHALHEVRKEEKSDLDNIKTGVKRAKGRPRTKIRSSSDKDPALQCQVCGKQLSNANSFRYHMQLHSDATPFLCSLCGEGFKTRNSYEGHKSIHDPNNPNTCEICGKAYRQPSSLRSHMLSHTGERPYQCDICGKGMTQKSGYKKHMLTHTGEKPHRCDICLRDFRYSSNLISHRRHHTGEKPYECPLCEKTFSTSEQLKRHTLVHTGEKPFICDICKKRFNRRSSLLAHRHTHEHSSSKEGPDSTTAKSIKADEPHTMKCTDRY